MTRQKTYVVIHPTNQKKRTKHQRWLGFRIFSIIKFIGNEFDKTDNSIANLNIPKKIKN